MIETVHDVLVPTEGLVTVELRDADTGQIQYSETRPNFISQQSYRVARWWQRFMWGYYHPNDPANALGIKPNEQPWFPATHLAYWNDATAEDAANEDRIKGDIVGYAPRVPTTTTTGKRGTLNVSECSLTDTAAKWVFDWSTSSGNGTFQSVGWTCIDPNNHLPVGRFPEDDQINFANAGNNGLASGEGTGLWWDPTASLWYLTEYVSSGNTMRVVSAAPGGGATTTLFTFPATTWYTGIPLNGLAKIGTDFICVGGPFASGTIRRHTSTGTQVWLGPNVAAGGLYDVTIDGSGNPWTICTDGKMRRHSPSDGSVNLTITPTFVASGSGWAIAYDPADGNFWVGRGVAVAKVDSAGTLVDGPIELLGAQTAEAAGSPIFNNMYIPVTGPRQPYIYTPHTVGGSTPATVSQGPTRVLTAFCGGASVSVMRATMKDGALWLSGKDSTSGGAIRTATLRGGTLGSRTRLTNPVVKANTQTLKITYQFNFS